MQILILTIKLISITSSTTTNDINNNKYSCIFQLNISYPAW